MHVNTPNPEQPRHNTQHNRKPPTVAQTKAAMHSENQADLRIRKPGFFTSITKSSEALADVCTDYLINADVPNVSGLCGYLGCSPGQLKKFINDAETKYQSQEEIPTNDLASYGDYGNHKIIVSALLKIEDILITRGLTGVYNSQLTKFMLSAFHDRNEKTIQESTSDNKITINVETHNPVDLKELEEYRRMEDAIHEQEVIELEAMGKPTEAPQEITEDMLTI